MSAAVVMLTAHGEVSAHRRRYTSASTLNDCTSAYVGRDSRATTHVVRTDIRC